jgi:hypothetical protein
MSDMSDMNEIATANILNMDLELTLPELEQAINYWRSLRPSIGEERALSPEVNVLASTYAFMIFHRVQSMPVEKLDAVTLQLVNAWRNKEQ